MNANFSTEEESEINLFLKSHFEKERDFEEPAPYPRFTDSRKKSLLHTPGNYQESKTKKSLRRSLLQASGVGSTYPDEEEKQYLAPKTERDKSSAFLPKKRLIRKLVSLVKPNAQKMHVALWKYVISIKNGENANTGERIKAYISKDAEIFTKGKAFEACKRDQLDKRTAEERLKLGSQNPNISRLEYWGIPKGIIKGFHKHTKIRTLFPWQIDLLRQDGVYDYGKSIVYFAPTSGGKSLPAELIMIRNIFARQKR